jgi:hypothetical protein
MIAIADPDHRDYATMKVLHQLVQHPGAVGSSKNLHALNSEVDFSSMEEGETLYIVGHGWSDSGEIKGVDSDKLLQWLNHKQKGIPAHVAGIVILTCYGGLEFENGALIERISAGLKHRIPVHGALGYSYGTPVTRETGFNSVLPLDRAVFYNDDNIDAMVDILKTLPSDDYYENWGGTGKQVFAGQPLGKAISEDRLRSWAEQFVVERGRIEGRMKEILTENYQEGSVKKTLRSLLRDKRFTDLVGEQYELHRMLFLPQGDSYRTSIR